MVSATAQLRGEETRDGLEMHFGLNYLSRFNMAGTFLNDNGIMCHNIRDTTMKWILWLSHQVLGYPVFQANRDLSNGQLFAMLVQLAKRCNDCNVQETKRV